MIEQLSHGHSPQGLLSIWLYLWKPPLCPQTQEDGDQTFNMWFLRDSQDLYHWDKNSEVWRDKTMCLWFVIPTSHPKRVPAFLETGTLDMARLLQVSLMPKPLSGT